MAPRDRKNDDVPSASRSTTLAMTERILYTCRGLRGTIDSRSVGIDASAGRPRLNEAVRSLEGRFLPTARKFRDLGAAGTKTIPELRLIDVNPTELASEELREPSTAEAGEADPSSLALLRMTGGAGAVALQASQ